MCHPSMNHGKNALASTFLFFMLSVTIDLASAQDQLGPIDNILIKNPYTSPADDKFGRGVVSGDFDGDGIDDLAISESSGTRLRIYRGVAFAIGTDPLFHFFSTTITIPSHNEQMVSGDFDGDGRDEIAVGASGATNNGMSAAGKVYVINRLVDGTWTVQTEVHAGGDYPGAAQVSANLGSELAAGDFDNDGYTDLAIAISGQIVSGGANAGAVMITYGSASGITSAQAHIIDRNNDGLGLAPMEDDYFGRSLAAGDFDGDGDDDLAIGIWKGTCPGDNYRGGAVVVLNGSLISGITNANSKIWQPGEQGIAGSCGASLYFGQALTTGYFGSRGFISPTWVDLAIGAAISDGNGAAVHVIFGSNSGLTATGNQLLVEPTTPEIGSGNTSFATQLASGVLSYNCVSSVCAGDSLVVNAPVADVNGVNNAGAVWIFSPATGQHGLAVDSARLILPLAPLKIAGPHDNDQFGNQLAIGDFNNDDRKDLAIGAYLYDDGGETDAGAVQVIYQADRLFVDGFD